MALSWHEEFTNYDKKLHERLDYLNEKVDKGFADVEERFRQVDRRFEQVDKRFDKLEDRFEGLHKDMHLRFESIHKLMFQGLLGIVGAIVTMSVGLGGLIVALM